MNSPPFFAQATVHAGERVPVDRSVFRALREAIESGETWYVRGLVRHEGKLAFVKTPWSDGWVLPGGAIEDGETLEAAIVREVREETGLSGTDPRPVGLVEQTFEWDGQRTTGYMAVFAMRAETETFGTDLGETDDEIEEVAWFESAPDRIDGLSSELLECLDDAF